MNRAIKDHVTHHKRMEKVDRKRANHLRQVLADQVIEKATQLAILNERKKMQVELEEYARHLEDLVRERTEKIKAAERFVAIGETAGMVGHDIRNPLQAITSDVYLAKNELASMPESDEKKNALESLTEIEANTEYINKIVADLQDYARIPMPQYTKVNVEKLFQEVLSSVTIPKEVAISYSLAKDFPVLTLDATYLKRIMTNLISNAIQAMPKEGKLAIDAFCKNGSVVISVADTGVGISDEDRDKIFTPLFTTKSKGQGFGLPVIKRLTESMGGTVTFDSEKGKGAKFTIKFPISQ